MRPDFDSFEDDLTQHDPLEAADSAPEEKAGDIFADDPLADDLTLAADSDVVAQIQASRNRPLRPHAKPRRPLSEPVPRRRSMTTARRPPRRSTEIPTPGDAASLIDRNASGDEFAAEPFWNPDATTQQQTERSSSLKATASRQRVWLGLVLVAAFVSAAMVAALIWLARVSFFA